MPVIFQAVEVLDPCNSPNLPTPVAGASRQKQEAGVSGTNCNGGAGVHGISAQGAGVRGESQFLVGVFGHSTNGDGIQGRTNAADHAGVSAVNDGVGIGLFASGKQAAGRFEGHVEVTGVVKAGNITASDITCSGDIRLFNGDIGERFAVLPTADISPGMLLSISESGQLQPCCRPYDTGVIGVVSGAGSLRPAVTLRYQNFDEPSAVVALAGTVYCLADASPGAIRPGDLMVASATPGHAMKAADLPRSLGAVVGKALGSLTDGRGLIPIVVCMR